MMGKVIRATTRRKAANIGESQVMGRAAVVWVVAAVQPVSYGQVLGLSEASESVRRISQTPLLPDIWSATAIVAGWFVVASIAARDPEVVRVWEMAAGILVASASLMFTYAALLAVGWSGGGWAASISIALAGSCFGRAWLLARQIWWVRHGGGR